MEGLSNERTNFFHLLRVQPSGEAECTHQDSSANMVQLLLTLMSPVKRFFAVCFGHAPVLSWGRHLQ